MSVAELKLISKWLATAEVLLTLILLAVIVRRGLIGSYKVFFAFMAFVPLGRIAYLFLDRSNYGYVYLTRTPVFWVFDIWIVYELYRNVLADYPGIVSFGRWVLMTVYGLAIGVSWFTSTFDYNVSAHESRTLFYYTFIERGVTTAQVVVLLSMTLFMRWFPAPLKRNFHVHTVILFFYFLITSSSLLIRNLTGDQVTLWVNFVILAASCLCLVGWIWQLSPEKTDKPVTYRKVGQEEEERILAGLRSINDTLVGAGKNR